MASHIQWFLSTILVLLFLSSDCYKLIKAENHAGGINIDHQKEFHSHIVEVSSLLPSADTCNLSPKGQRLGSSLQVSHRHGPCSPLSTDKSDLPSHEEILDSDRTRVESIRNRMKPRPVEQVDIDSVRQKKGVALPTKSGSTIGSGNYIVTVGLGTPKKELSLIFDTGSDFTWTQCKPCTRSCYKQQEAIFDPFVSSTYYNVTCSSSLCSEVRSATSATPGCSATTCIYGIQYGDSSFSVGYFARDTLFLGSTDYVPNFYFGCGENNQGLFGGSAGLIGLGRNKLSAVSQTASKYGNYFSYCLPSKPSATGHLTFGRGGLYSKSIKYTPLSSSSEGPSFYFLQLQGISVGGQKLSISPSVFSTAGTLIDSGTVISRLPPDAYSALSTAFSKAMAKYPKAPALSILDTCFDFSSYTTVTVPKIGLLFGGGTQIELPQQGIFYVKDLSQVCLAFAGNSDATDIGILGNVQQLTFDVVYDVAGGKLGFGTGGCA